MMPNKFINGYMKDEEATTTSNNIKDRDCSVVSFYDMSLFWILFHDDLDTRNKFNQLYTKKKYSHEELKNAEIGQVVFALNEGQCCRAEIVAIEAIDLETVYVCFLLDFGLIVRTKHIYSLSWEVSEIQPFAKRAVLSTTPLQTSSTDVINKFIINKCGPEVNVRFHTHYKYKNYIIGDLIVVQDGRSFSICEELDKTGLTSQKMFLNNIGIPNFKIGNKPLSKIYDNIVNMTNFQVKNVDNLPPYYYHLTMRNYYEFELVEDGLVIVDPLLIDNENKHQNSKTSLPSNHSGSMNNICEFDDNIKLKDVVSSSARKDEEIQNNTSNFYRKKCIVKEDCELYKHIEVKHNKGGKKKEYSIKKIDNNENSTHETENSTLDLTNKMNDLIAKYNYLKSTEDYEEIFHEFQKNVFSINAMSFEQLNAYMATTFYGRQGVEKANKTEEEEENVNENLRRVFYKTEEKDYFKVSTKIFPKYQNGREMEPRPLFHIHEMNGGIKPLFQINKMPFNKEIISSLNELEIMEPKGTQSYVWPSLFRGYNTCVVSSTRGGKTISYLPVICNYLFDIHPNLPKINSPIALVICPKVSIVEKVYKQCNILLNKTCKNNVQEFSSTLDLKLQKNADIVITTPKIFVELCKQKVLSIKRLHYVVFEDASDCFELYPQEIHFIMEAMENVVVQREDYVSLQVVTVSKYWTEPLEDFLLTLQDPPVICIDEHIEAAMYGRAKIHLYFTKPDVMGFRVTEIVGDKWKWIKTVIICNTITQKLLDYISVQGVTYVTVTDDCSATSVNRRWCESKLGSYFVIVCTDKAFREKLTVVDAELIVQYMLPEDMADFSFRFSGFVDRYDSVLNTDVEKMRRYNMHIILDETDENQLQKVFCPLYRAFMHNDVFLNEVPASKDFIKDLRTKYENQKLTENRPLCSHLLYHPCPDIQCPHRHILSLKDTLNTLPRSGLIKLSILHVLSPVKLACRILAFDLDYPEFEFQYRDKGSEIRALLERERCSVVPVPSGEVRAGMLCAAERERREFAYVRGGMERGRVLEVGDGVLVRFIDTGEEKYIPESYLYYLPEELYENLPQTTVVHLLNICPPDHDVTWSAAYTARLNQQLEKVEGKHFIGKVSLQLGDGLFVEDLFLHSHTDDDDDFSYTEDISIRKFLNSMHLTTNCKQLHYLHGLCKKYAIPLSGNEL